MTDHLTKEKRSWNMSRIGSKNTGLELKVRKFLYSMGFRYRLHNSKIPGKPDIANQSKKIAVFVHGCFWHRHESCKLASVPKTNTEFWLNKFEYNKRRDRKNTEKLSELGWKVYTIWECETKIEHELKKIIKDILS